MKNNHPNRSRRQQAQAEQRLAYPGPDKLVIMVAFEQDGRVYEIKQELFRRSVVFASMGPEAFLGHAADRIILETLKHARQSGWLIEPRNPTGRVPSAGPNMQNIPVRSPEGQAIRDSAIAHITGEAPDGSPDSSSE